MGLTGFPNVKFSHYNEWDQLTIVASDEQTNFPASNTQRRQLTRTWKFDAKSAAVTGKINGSAIQVDICAVLNTNFTSGAQVKIQGSDDDFTTTPLDQALTRSTDGYNWIHVFSSTQTYDDYRVYLNDIAHPDTEQYIGRVWLGIFEFEPAVGYADGSKADGIAKVDQSVVNVSDGRQKSSIQKVKYRVYSFLFDKCDQVTEYDEMIEDVGKSREFITLKKPLDDNLNESYPDPEDNFIYGMNTKYEKSNILQDIFTFSLEIEDEK